MPEFRLRIWQEQVLFDCRDYIVEADTLKAACELLWSAHTKASETSDLVPHARISTADPGRFDEVVELDPDEIVVGDQGITLIDEKGDRVRDLHGVPSGCDQLGQPLVFDTEAKFVPESEAE